MASHVSGVFLNPEHFGETFTHTNPAAGGGATAIVGVLDEDPPSAPINGADGDRVVRSGALHIAASVVVSVAEGNASKFVRDGETWYAKSRTVEGDIQVVRVVFATLTAIRRGAWNGTQQR